MLGRTHLLAGLILAIVLVHFFSHSFIIGLISFFLCLFGSLLPDIDEKSSLIGRHFRLVSFFSRHRGFFHSLFALLLFTLPFYFLFQSPLPAISFMIAYFSHLLLDMMTKAGLRLYPSRMKIRGFIKVGGFLEKIIFLLLLLLFILLLLFVF